MNSPRNRRLRARALRAFAADIRPRLWWQGAQQPRFAHSSNPLGKGYYLDEASAIDKPLPNIEDRGRRSAAGTTAPIRSASPPIRRVGCCASRRCSRSTTAASSTSTPSAACSTTPTRASPATWCAPATRSRSRVLGFAPRLALAIPACPVEMVLQLGDRVHVRELELQEVLLDLRVGLVDLGYRKLCSYDFVAHQPGR